MKSSSDLYENVALVYIRLVRKESEAAAATVERIHATFGAHAALRVALIIKILLLDTEQNRLIPNIDNYAHLLEDYPDAIPLAKVAMACCITSWKAASVKVAVRSELAGKSVNYARIASTGCR